METISRIFVRVLSEGEWFGAWAPVNAIPKEGEGDVFILADNGLTEDDEYEFFEPGIEVRVEAFTDEHGEQFWGVTETTFHSVNSEPK